MQFQRGLLVWGKMKRCPYWPAFILDASDCNKDINNDKNCWLFWFGTHNISLVKKENIYSFKEGCKKNFHKRKNIKKNCLDEALQILAETNDVKYDEKIHSWIDDDFESTFPIQFQWYKQELPKLIENSIRPPQTSAVSIEGPEKLIEKVRNGEETLHDICIACCRSNCTTTVETHPLFIGKVCPQCKKDVDRANRLPLGRMQVYCVICGQGGKMVFCSQKTCKRGYCEECILYLDSKTAFKKIVSTENWQCYYCHPIKSSKCLILKKAEKRPASPDDLFDSLFQKNNNCKMPDEKPPDKSKIDKVIKKLIDESVEMEDVCIACCEEDIKIIGLHPLFQGGVCNECLDDVIQVCNLPVGVRQQICVVCGQGGLLIFCDNTKCLRAYCKICIEWMDYGRTFDTIAKIKYWLCYYCIPNVPNNCLIKKRSSKSFGNIPRFSHDNDILKMEDGDYSGNSSECFISKEIRTICDIADHLPSSSKHQTFASETSAVNNKDAPSTSRDHAFVSEVSVFNNKEEEYGKEEEEDIEDVFIRRPSLKDLKGFYTRKYF